MSDCPTDCATCAISDTRTSPQPPLLNGRAPQWDAIHVLVQGPQLVEEWLDSITPDLFPDPDTRELYAAINAAGRNGLGGKEWSGRVFAGCANDTQRMLLLLFNGKPLPHGSHRPADYAAAVMARLLSEAAIARRDELKRFFASPENAPPSQHQLQSDIATLDRYIADLGLYFACVTETPND